MSNVLIHIGYPKAGSSYIQSWLQAHPAVHYEPDAFTGFYSIYDLCRYAQKIESVHECYAISSEHLVFWKGAVDIVGVKSSPQYNVSTYHTKLCQTLKAVYPQAKILIVTRGYSSYYPSFYSQYLSGGGVMSFTEIMKVFGDFIKNIHDYTRVVTLFREVWGSENVLTLPYELLRENPKEFTSAIEDFAGIKQPFSFTEEKINPSFDEKLIGTYRKVSRSLYSIIQPLPYSIQQKVYRMYVQQLEEKRPHPIMMALSKVVSDKIEVEEFAPAAKTLAGGAEIFRTEKMYQPYLHDYYL